MTDFFRSRFAVDDTGSPSQFRNPGFPGETFCFFQIRKSRKILVFQKALDARTLLELKVLWFLNFSQHTLFLLIPKKFCKFLKFFDINLRDSSITTSLVFSL